MRRLRESESRVNFFTKGAGHTANEREYNLKDNKMNIEPQNRLINYVKNEFKNIIDGILNRYDNYVYTNEYKRFYKGQTGVISYIRDKVKWYHSKVSLATAWFSSYTIRIYNNTIKHGLRRTKGNS